MKNAVFLDRDGTINFDYSHVFDPKRLSILPSVSEAIFKLKNAGFLVIIITNQSCIGRALASEEAVQSTNARMIELLLQENQNATIDKILIAPDHPDRPTNRRKPNPGMIFEAAAEFNLDLKNCWVIGDKVSDPQTGLAAGIPSKQCLLVKPNQTEEINSVEFQVFKNLLEASNYILKNQKKA